MSFGIMGNVLEAQEKEITELTAKLEQSEQNVKDFEALAHTWMRSYNEEVPKLKVRITELEQTVESLREEIDELEAAARYNSRN